MLIFLLSFLVSLISYYFFIRRLPPTFGAVRDQPDVKPVDIEAAPGSRHKWLTVRGPVELIVIAMGFVVVMNGVAYLIIDQLYAPSVRLFGFIDFLRSEFAAQIFYGVAAGFTVGRIIDLSYFAEATTDGDRRSLIERRRRFYASGLTALIVAALLTASGNSISDLLSRVTVFKTPFAELQVSNAASSSREVQQATTVSGGTSTKDNVREALQLLALFDEILETDRRYASSLQFEGGDAETSGYIPPAQIPELYRDLVAPVMRCIYVVYVIDRDRAFIANLLRPLIDDLRAITHQAGLGGPTTQVDMSDDIRHILEVVRNLSRDRAGETPVPVSATSQINMERECTVERFDEIEARIFQSAPAEQIGPSPIEGTDRISAMLASLPSDKRPYLTLFLSYVLMATDSEFAAVAEIDRWRREHGQSVYRPGSSVLLWHQFRLNRELIQMLSGMGAANEIPDVTLLLADLNKETLAIIEQLAEPRDWDEIYSASTACRDIPLRRRADESFEDYLRRFHIIYSNLYAYYGARTFVETDRHVNGALLAAERIYDYSFECSSPLVPDLKNMENLETASSVFVAFARDVAGAEYRKAEIADMLSKAGAGFGRCLYGLEVANNQRLKDIEDDELFIGSRIDKSQPQLFDRCKWGAEELNRIAH